MFLLCSFIWERYKANKIHIIRDNRKVVECRSKEQSWYSQCSMLEVTFFHKESCNCKNFYCCPLFSTILTSQKTSNSYLSLTRHFNISRYFFITKYIIVAHVEYTLLIVGWFNHFILSCSKTPVWGISNRVLQTNLVLLKSNSGYRGDLKLSTQKYFSTPYKLA